MKLGIDEVGRGSLAGPLVVGAVSLLRPIAGLKDSKLLSRAERERLAKIIYQKATLATLGWVWPHEIDQLGLTNATTIAIKRALSLAEGPIESIIIDGKYNFLSDYANSLTMVKADSLVPAVSAASIIAKVARDNYMRAIDSYFPAYGFSDHVGYGTARHLSALLKSGPCVLHRLSFSPLREETLNSL